MMAVFAALLLLGSPAHAATDCKSRIAAMEGKQNAIAQPRTRELFAFDLKRAADELAEGDEDECAEAIDHAQQLLDMK